MTNKNTKVLLIKIVLSVFCLFLYSTSTSAQNLDYESIRSVVEKYTGIKEMKPTTTL
jgi:hypothetical protein